MDLDSLRCFEAAASTLNFRAAAGRVHLSPAAFSERIAGLEAALDVKLFARSTRRVELSREGRRILPLAREVLEGAARLRAAAQEPGASERFELTIGTRFELGASWLCPALTPLERRRPERRIHLYNGDTPDLLARLERGDLDAVVASMRLTSPRLTYAALHPEAYAFVARRPVLRRREDARGVTLVDVSLDLPLFRYFLDALPDAEPWPFAELSFMGGIANIRARVLARDAHVAVLPEYFVRRDLARGALVRLMPSVRLRSDAFRLVWRAGHPRALDLLALATELRAMPLR